MDDAIIAEGLTKIYKSRAGGTRARWARSDCRGGHRTEPARSQRAGKTTTVRILATLLQPDGRASVLGYDVVRQARQVREVIGLSGQYAAVDENLTGPRTCRCSAASTSCPAPRQARAGELLEQFGLSDAANRQVKTYSGGMRRRLDLAASLIARPRLLFLDEPTTGLDPRSRLGMWDVIQDLVRAAPRCCSPPSTSRRPTGSPTRSPSSTMRQDHRRGHHRRAEGRRSAERGWRSSSTRRTTSRRPGAGSSCVADVAVDEHTRRLTVPDGGTQLLSVIRALDDAGIPIDDVGLRRPTLDDVFLS